MHVFGASLVIDKGYIGAAYTRQDAEYGLPGHSHANGVCHLHGYPFPAPGRIDLHCIGHGNYGNPLTNPDSDTALIDLRSERVTNSRMPTRPVTIALSSTDTRGSIGTMSVSRETISWP